MPYKLSLTRDTKRFLDELDAKQYRQVVRCIFGLMTEPLPGDSQQLRGSQYRRVDQGEYRIVHDVGEDTIIIVMVGKRNDGEVYARLDRKK